MFKSPPGEENATGSPASLDSYAQNNDRKVDVTEDNSTFAAPEEDNTEPKVDLEEQLAQRNTPQGIIPLGEGQGLAHRGRHNDKSTVSFKETPEVDISPITRLYRKKNTYSAEEVVFFRERESSRFQAGEDNTPPSPFLEKDTLDEQFYKNTEGNLIQAKENKRLQEGKST